MLSALMGGQHTIPTRVQDRGMPYRLNQAEAYLGENCESALGLLSHHFALQNKVIHTIWSPPDLHVLQTVCKERHILA